MSAADWYVRPVEPGVRHHLVPAVASGDAPRLALCQAESPSWLPHQETDDPSRPCPLCAAADADQGRGGPARGVRSGEPPMPWGQPGDIRGQ